MTTAGAVAVTSSSISDRFFLGGVGGGLRGFGIRACGPTDQRHGSASSSSRPTSAAASPSAAAVPLSARGSDVTGAAAARAEADARALAAAAAATASQAVDFIGADLSVSVLAALRFELPWKNLRDIGIFGHVFVNGAGMSLLGGASGAGLSRAAAPSSAAASPSRGAPPSSASPASSSFPLSRAVAAAAGELYSTWRWSAVRGDCFFRFFFLSSENFDSHPLSLPPKNNSRPPNRAPASSGPRASATLRSTSSRCSRHSPTTCRGQG